MPAPHVQEGRALGTESTWASIAHRISDSVPETVTAEQTMLMTYALLGRHLWEVLGFPNKDAALRSSQPVYLGIAEEYNNARSRFVCVCVRARVRVCARAVVLYV